MVEERSASPEHIKKSELAIQLFLTFFFKGTLWSFQPEALLWSNAFSSGSSLCVAIQIEARGPLFKRKCAFVRPRGGIKCFVTKLTVLCAYENTSQEACCIIALHEREKTRHKAVRD